MHHDIKKRYDHFLSYVQEVADFVIKLKQTTSIQIEKKSRIDLVTQVDKGSEEMIRKEIYRMFPDDSILGEEFGLLEGSSNYKWIIDPIDGTTNFAHNLPLYCISIGLEDKTNNEIVIGIVAMPDMKEVYHAMKGEGAYKNQTKIVVSQNETLENSLLCTGFPQIDQSKIDDLGKMYSHMLKKSRGVRRTGSAALDLCWVAEGRFDGFYEFGLKPWDTSGASIIIEEAGGKISTIDGNTYHPNKTSIVASNKKIHEELLKNLEESGIVLEN